MQTAQPPALRFDAAKLLVYYIVSNKTYIKRYYIK